MEFENVGYPNLGFIEERDEIEEPQLPTEMQEEWFETEEEDLRDK